MTGDAARPELAWQASLFAETPPRPDDTFATLSRRVLDDGAWVEHAAGWLDGADRLFDELLRRAGWEQRTRHLYDQEVVQPRLTAGWRARPLGEANPVIDRVHAILARRYRVAFDSGGINLYRDGRDSVAWHGDQILRNKPESLVAILSLGHPRRLLLRPRGGGRSVPYELHSGDLLVMGGTCQRTWQHSVPKVATAGPRMSVTFRWHPD